MCISPPKTSVPTAAASWSPDCCQSCVGGIPLMGRRRGLSALYAHIWDSFLEREIISYFHRPRPPKFEFPQGEGVIRTHFRLCDNVCVVGVGNRASRGLNGPRVLYGARGKVANTCDGILSTFSCLPLLRIVRMFACFCMCVEGILLRTHTNANDNQIFMSW